MFRSQRMIVLEKLDRAEGTWLDMPTLMCVGRNGFIASLTKRLSELRALGHNIENRKEYKDGQIHSYYRLVRSK